MAYVRNLTPPLIAEVLASIVLVWAAAAEAGTISAQGNVTALTDATQLGSSVLVGAFDEPNAANFDPVPLDVYSSLGLTFHTGPLSSALPGVTTPGDAFQCLYDEPLACFQPRSLEVANKRAR